MDAPLTEKDLKRFMNITRIHVQFDWAETEGTTIREEREVSTVLEAPAIVEFFADKTIHRQRVRVSGSIDPVGVKHAPNALLRAHLIAAGFRSTEIFDLEQFVVEVLPE